MESIARRRTCIQAANQFMKDGELYHMRGPSVEYKCTHFNKQRYIRGDKTFTTEIHQFDEVSTDLEDSKGNIIFEGDILETPDSINADSHYCVILNNGIFWVGEYWESPEIYLHEFLSEAPETKIIGRITSHENHNGSKLIFDFDKNDVFRKKDYASNKN
jgi:hypothetical protein